MGRRSDLPIAIIVAVLFYLFVWKNQNFQSWFSKVTQRGGGGTTTTTTTKTTTKGGKTTTTKPTQSGGGGSISVGGSGWQSVPASNLETHSFASSSAKTLREEFGVTQTSDNFAFDLRFKFAEATNDQCTLEFAGKPHSGSNDRSGYKFRLGEDGKGSYLQKQTGTDYGPALSKSGVNLTQGHEYIARAVKQNIMSAGKCVGVHLEGWLQDVTAGGSLNKICQYDDRSSPFCAISGSRAGARQDGRKNSSLRFFIAYRQISLSPIGGSPPAAKMAEVRAQEAHQQWGDYVSNYYTAYAASLPKITTKVANLRQSDL